MGVASAITLLRGFVVAALLPIEDFGIYAVLVAIGAFSSSLLGLGQIEGTMKAFPRAWDDGASIGVCNKADSLVKSIFGRAAFVAILCMMVCFYISKPTWIVMAFLAAGVAVATATIGIYVSILRASGDLKALGKITFFRSLIAIFLCTIGAHLAGWQGAIGGEVTAALLGGLFSRYTGLKLAQPRAISQPDSAAQSIGHLTGGAWLLFATLAATAPFYLDRLLVATFLGNEAAGQYGFLMLFVTSASTLAGIVCQKVGPQLVKARTENIAEDESLILVAKWIFGQAGVVIVCILLAYLLMTFGPLAFYIRSYQLSGEFFITVAALAAAQGAVLLDWLLISNDRERMVFIASCAYLCIVASICIALFYGSTNPTLSKFLLAMVLAKFAYVGVQTYMIVNSKLAKKEG